MHMSGEAPRTPPKLVVRVNFHKQSKFHSVVFPDRALSELVPSNFFVSADTEKYMAKMHGATPSNLAQGGLISSNATFSYPRAGARCARAIWDANGSHQIFLNGRELDLLVVSHENTVEFAALTITFVLLCCDLGSRTQQTHKNPILSAVNLSVGDANNLGKVAPSPIVYRKCVKSTEPSTQLDRSAGSEI
jgi:hypothetical protein